MNVTAATRTAMPCAASASVPIAPIISSDAKKRPDSDTSVSPTGQPTRKRRARISASARPMLRNNSHRAMPGPRAA